MGLKPALDGVMRQARLTTFRNGRARVEKVTLLNGARALKFKQTDEALICDLPQEMGEAEPAVCAED